MLDPLCACGAPAPALGGTPYVLLVVDTAVDQVVALLSGEFDFAQCEAGCRLEVRASIVFHDTYSNVLALSLAENTDIRALAPIWTGLSARPVNIGDPESLRREIIAVIRRRFAHVAPALIKTPVDRFDFVTERWRVFRPQSFAAVRVAIRTGLVAMDPASGASATSVLAEVLGQMVVCTWAGMFLEWVQNDKTVSLESDLGEYIDRMPRANDPRRDPVADFDRILEPLRPTENLRSRYIYHAMRAAMYGQLGLANPDADVWACLWLFMELSKRAAERAGSDADYSSMLVSAERVQATIPPDNARFAGAIAAQDNSPMLRLIGDVSAEVVHQLCAEIFSEFGFAQQWISVFRGQQIQAEIDDVADLIIGQISTGSHFEWVREIARVLVDHRRVDDVRRVAVAALEQCEPSLRFEIEIWLLRSLARMDRHGEVLSEIGDEVQPAETDLPPYVQAAYLDVRTFSLRMTGRMQDALCQFQSASSEVLDEPNYRESLAVRHAALLKDNGFPAQALQLLESILEASEKVEPGVYDSLAATTRRFGRYRAAARYARQAYDAALVDRMAFDVEHFAALSMVYDAEAGCAIDSDLFNLVRDIDVAHKPYDVMLGAMAVLSQRRDAIGGAQKSFIDDVAPLAREIAHAAIESRNMRMMLVALTVGARYDELFRREYAEESWIRAHNMLFGKFGVLVPEFVMYAGLHLVARGEWDSGRAMLRAALKFQALPLGGDAGFGESVSAGGRDKQLVDSIAAAVSGAEGATAADIRIAGELGRGLVGRRLPRGAETTQFSWPDKGLDDEVVAAIAPPVGRVAVLEFVSGGPETGAMLTVVAASAGPKSIRLNLPDVDLARTMRRLRTKLSNWTKGRAGSPFDLPEWRECQDWLSRNLNEHLEAGDHLVAIPHADWHTLPWHVAAFGHVTCSYEPSWTSLLQTTSQAPTRPKTEGVFAVPRQGDPAEIVEAMAAYVSATDDPGQQGVFVAGPYGGRRELADVLETVDLATLIAHGYLDERSGDVALMIASDGALPLAHSVAANSARSNTPFRLARTGRAVRCPTHGLLRRMWHRKRAHSRPRRAPQYLQHPAPSRTRQLRCPAMGHRRGRRAADPARGPDAVSNRTWSRRMLGSGHTKRDRSRLAVLAGEQPGTRRRLAMTDSFADELNEQQMDTDSLFQALRYYLAELLDDLPAEDMLGEIRAAERDSQVDAELTRFERDSWLLEVAALRVLSSAWSDPAQRGAVRRALAEAKGKLPVIEVAILAIAAMYGMYLIATGGVKRTEKTYEREGTVYKEVTEYADPVDPLRSVTGLFAPPQSANSDQVESATDDSAP